MSGLIAPDDRATTLAPRAPPLSSRFTSFLPVDCVPEPRMFKPANETNGISDFAAQLKANGVELVKNVHETPWNTREIVIHDDQGHTLYLGEPQ
jgi:hypothetical protein